MCCYDKLSIDGGPLVHCVACHQCLFRYRICRTPMHTSMMRRGTFKIVLLGIFIDHTTHTKQLYIFAYTLSMTFRCFHNWIWLCMLWEDRIHPLDPVHYHLSVLLTHQHNRGHRTHTQHIQWTLILSMLHCNISFTSQHFYI